MTSLPHNSRRWVTKHASDECGMGTTLVKWKFQDDDKCPRCGESEMGLHVSQCRMSGADATWQHNWSALITKLDNLETHPLLQETLLHCIQSWRLAQPTVHDPPAEVAAAVVEQEAIGWKNLLEGLPSKQWAQLQQQHCNGVQSRRTGSKWMQQVLLSLHTLARGQWLHRNDVKHEVLLPRQHRMIQLLDDAIRHEFLRGPLDLPPGGHLRFNANLLILLLAGLFRSNRRGFLI